MSTRKILAALTIAGAAAGAVLAPPAGAVSVPDRQTVLIGGTKVLTPGPVVTGYDDFEWSGPRRLR